MKSLTTILFLFAFFITIKAQVAINTDESLPDASAILDISSTEKGVLIPRMSSAEREAISNPATGLLVYDSTENSFWYYANTMWTEIGKGAFSSENGITFSNNTDDDFVFGADSLNHGSDEEFKLFFDKSKGAFRVGTVDDNSWDEDNIGNHSFAAGENTIASGAFATALGSTNVASGYGAMAFGNGNEASGYSTTAFGRFNVAEGSSATAFGAYTEAQGGVSTAFGDRTVAYSYGETALGIYNTVYNPNLTTVYHANDRLLVVGNGTDDDNRSDALIVYKNGNTELNGSLTIDGAYTFPTTDGTNSQVMTTDGNGILSWSNLNITALTDADNDTKIQVEESSNEDMIRFDLGGIEYLRLDNGRIHTLNTGRSVFLGEDTGVNDDLSNNSNVFIGYQAGHQNTSGEDNKFIGYRSGYKNTTGNNNLFMGWDAGYNNTTGNDNIGLGFYTGNSISTGSRNILIGSEAGNAISTGANNLIIGYNGGEELKTGESNIFIGHKSGGGETGSNKLYIENSNSSSPLIYGDFEADSLQINGKLNINGAFNFPTTDGTASQVLATDGNGTVSWTTAGNGAFTSENGLTTSNNHADDFVFGADSLNYVSAVMATNYFLIEVKEPLERDSLIILIGTKVI